MIVIIEDSENTKKGYSSRFNREDVDSAVFNPGEFAEWVNVADDSEIATIEAFLIGHSASSLELPKAIKDRSQAPIIAVSDFDSPEETLSFIESGVDDVVRKPVSPREILARAAAIRQRLRAIHNHTDIGPLRVFSDGSDVQLYGQDFKLPRRELRVLEYTIANRGRYSSKTQIFNAIYGIYDEEIEPEIVVGLIDSLRKKLHQALGHDPIRSDKIRGYAFEWDPPVATQATGIQAHGVKEKIPQELLPAKRLRLAEAVRQSDPTIFEGWKAVQQSYPQVNYVATEVDETTFDIHAGGLFTGRVILLLTIPYRLFGKSALASLAIPADVKGSIDVSNFVALTDFTFATGTSP
ncbi:response regulator transcription factor [Rhizobium leguminosarum]|nr:response regulator transcription factor [Rhizobium leguminosarum]